MCEKDIYVKAQGRVLCDCRSSVALEADVPAGDREEGRDNNAAEVGVIVCFYRPLIYGSHVLCIPRHLK